MVLVGSIDEIVETLQERRERYGFSYIVVLEPVVEAFAPVVPAHRWRPWGVPHVLLGNLDIGCAGCRARECPVPGQPCLKPFTAAAVVDAVEFLVHASVQLAEPTRASA